MNLHHGLITADRARGILLRGDEEDKTGRYLLRSVASGDDVISYVMRNEIGHLYLPSEQSDIVKNNPHVSHSISEKVCSSVQLFK